MLAGYIGASWAYPATAAIALAVTIVLGTLSFQFVEQPALRLTKYLKYGPGRAKKPVSERAPSFGLAAKRG
jgi:peptidoglycan/LPS O-acetylase OafA/YrhL